MLNTVTSSRRKRKWREVVMISARRVATPKIARTLDSRATQSRHTLKREIEDVIQSRSRAGPTRLTKDSDTRHAERQKPPRCHKSRPWCKLTAFGYKMTLIWQTIQRTVRQSPGGTFTAAYGGLARSIYRKMSNPPHWIRCELTDAKRSISMANVFKNKGTYMPSPGSPCIPGGCQLLYADVTASDLLAPTWMT